MELSDKQACEIEHTEKPQSANAVRAFKRKYRTNRKKNFQKSSELKLPFKSKPVETVEVNIHMWTDSAWQKVNLATHLKNKTILQFADLK